MRVKTLVSIAKLAQTALTTEPIANSKMSSLLLYKRFRNIAYIFKDCAKLAFA